ncbi:MAG: amidohydrolase [Armatimonadetes bacterium]|nr:amidohydrolase [Armatimonadota bacterium]
MIYRAHFIIPITQDPIEGGEVLVRNGRIEAMGADVSTAAPGEPVEDLGHAAILPGLVNAHSHLDYTIFRGRLDNEPFFPWIRSLTELGARLQYDDFLASARLGALQMIRSGVTAVGDSSFSGAAARAAAEAGLRGIVYQETFGPDPSEDYREQIEALSERIEELQAEAGERISVGVSPHSVYTSSERLLRLVADLAADYGLPVAMHVAETQEEAEFVEKGAGQIAEFYSRFGFDFDPKGKSPVAYLHDIGLLGEKTTAAHCVYVTEDDLDILAEEHVTVAHCPKSNAKLAVGTAPLDRIVTRGILTGIGTDSAVSDNAMDMFEEMRFSVLMQRAAWRDAGALDAQRALELATLGGASALGFESEIGSIEPGKRADLIAVDLSSSSVFPTSDPYSALVYSCTSADVILSLIDGEPVYRRGEFLRTDADGIRQQAALLAARL